jgi:putative addiction module killer protein
MKLTIKQREAMVYEEPSGKLRFEVYLDGLKDGLYEMREDFGPGYRIYFTVDGDEIILLLLVGTKREQSRDIEKAYGYLETERKKRGKK